MGKRPPARNVAVSPEIVVRLGDASVVASPTRSETSNAVEISRPNKRPAAVMVSRPDACPVLNEVPPMPINWPVFVLNGSETEPAGKPNRLDASNDGKPLVSKSVIVPKFRPRATPNWKPPVVSRVITLPLIFLASERLTSAKRTFRFTCIGVAVFNRLTTRVSSPTRSEEHTSELQSRENLVCRLLLEKK